MDKLAVESPSSLKDGSNVNPCLFVVLLLALRLITFNDEHNVKNERNVGSF